MTNIMHNLKKLSGTHDAPKHNCPVVEGDLRFFVHDGPALRDMHELDEALKTMSDAQYRYHVTGDRNDFAAWIGSVLHDEHCAKDLLHAHSRQAAQHVVANHLNCL